MNFEYLKSCIWYNICGKSWLSFLKPYSLDNWISRHNLNVMIFDKKYNFQLGKLCMINSEICQDMEMYKHYKSYINIHESGIIIAILVVFVILTLKLPRKMFLFLIVINQIYLYSFKNYELNGLCALQ
jgi:hypothetical protein